MKFKKSILKIVAFLLILLMVLIRWNSIFKFKWGDGVYQVEKFYELPKDSVDLLFVGSSHAIVNFNVGKLYDDYGITSFVFGGAMQPMWNSYYALKEALKTQKPKLIVLEGYSVCFTGNYAIDQYLIKNYNGYKPSKNKMDILKVSAPEEKQKEIFLEYPAYHTRYTNLDRGDFLKNVGDIYYDDWKGEAYPDVTARLAHMDISTVSEIQKLPPKIEEYYRKTIELAKEKDIDIIVFVAPYAGVNVDDAMRYNAAEMIAREYEVPFINCNLKLDEIGIDYQTDGMDYSHLNYKGSEKVTKYLGDHVLNDYNLPDHRGDDRYATWQRHADYVREYLYNLRLIDTNDADALIDKLNSENHVLYVCVDGKIARNDSQIKRYLDKLGIAGDIRNGIWCIDGGDVKWGMEGDMGEYYTSMGSHDFYILRADVGAGEVYNIIMVDKDEYFPKAVNGINVLVYDKYADYVVDHFGITVDNDYLVIREAKE